MRAKKSNFISQFIKSAEGIKRCGPEDDIGSCLSILESSHSPVFVFDSSDKFLGILSVSEILYKKHLPFHTKAKNCLTPVHYFNKECTIFEAIRLMIESKIYTLPVFNEKKDVIGVIRGRDILDDVLNESQYRRILNETLKTKKAQVINEHKTMGEGYDYLKEKNISRVILVNDKGKLKGIVSRKDIAGILLEPAGRQRFSMRKGSPTSHSFDEEKIRRIGHPLRKYAKINVLTYPASRPPVSAAKCLLDSKLNSIVLVDGLMRPTGLISIRDLLSAALGLEEKADIPIVFHAHKSLMPALKDSILRLTQKFSKNFDKKKPIRLVYLYTKTVKNREKQISDYEITLQIKCVDGHVYVSAGTGKNFLTALRNCLKRVERQESNGL